MAFVAVHLQPLAIAYGPKMTEGIALFSTEDVEFYELVLGWRIERTF